jgi:formylglycine-generating enzyme required for sulfatase activity/S1-C subfamily serine protease
MKRKAVFFWLVAMFLCWGNPGPDASAENPGGPAEKPAGTGVIVHSEGYILTAHHVVATARRIVVVTAGEIRNPAVVVSADRDQDLALLKIETVGLSEAPLGYAGVVRLDQEVIVAGFSFGLREISVTRGRVAAVRTKGVRRVFQVDAAINPGNSGGAVFNQRGEIVGIVTTKFNHPSGIATEGMAFAVPISYATPLLANIPDFDFSTIGAVGKKRKEAKKDREKLVQELARATVRIETVPVSSESPVTQAGHAGPTAGLPKTDGGREPAPVRKPSPSPERAASERDDSDAVARVNQQLAVAQREELQGLAQRSILPPEGMALVPAGEFLMGTEDGFPDARPLHQVYLSSYWIDKYEVTNAQYRFCVRSGVCSPPKDSKAFADPQRAQHPVTNLTWGQARTFCQWSGRRLPTEAEWEKAARGTDGRWYPWGNSVEVVQSRLKDRDAKIGGNGPEPVGSLPETVSPYGVQDLTGNVWEWVNDWYAEDFYARAPSHDPQGPLRGSFRVLRGGDWSQSAPELRASVRAWDEMTYWGPRLGFRCAADVP